MTGVLTMSDNFSFLLARLSRRGLFAALIALAVFAAPAPVDAADLKTAVVDTKQIMATLAEASGMKDRLEAEREKLTRQLKAIAEKAKVRAMTLKRTALIFQKSKSVASNGRLRGLQNEAQLMQRQFQEELDQREQEELLLLRNELNGLIKNFLKKKKFDLVFFSEALAGFKPEMDISSDIIKLIKSEYKKSSKSKK